MAFPLILASASPRRTALLHQVGIAHSVMPVDIDESPLADERPWNQVLRLAAAKADTAFARLGGDQQNSVILASDTLIALDGESIGKPKDRADSHHILSQLSGRTHDVLTSISLKSATRQRNECIRTKVQFAVLTAQQIDAYWATGEPKDKAGSYAIQGIGGQFVKAIEGSASAVIGLPLYETIQLLNEFGAIE